jgi:hypothetical protein
MRHRPSQIRGQAANRARSSATTSFGPSSRSRMSALPWTRHSVRRRLLAGKSEFCLPWAVHVDNLPVVFGDALRVKGSTGGYPAYRGGSGLGGGSVVPEHHQSTAKPGSTAKLRPDARTTPCMRHTSPGSTEPVDHTPQAGTRDPSEKMATYPEEPSGCHNHRSSQPHVCDARAGGGCGALPGGDQVRGAVVYAGGFCRRLRRHRARGSAPLGREPRPLPDRRSRARPERRSRTEIGRQTIPLDQRAYRLFASLTAYAATVRFYTNVKHS